MTKPLKPVDTCCLRHCDREVAAEVFDDVLLDNHFWFKMTFAACMEHEGYVLGKLADSQSGVLTLKKVGEVILGCEPKPPSCPLHTCGEEGEAQERVPVSQLCAVRGCGLVASVSVPPGDSGAPHYLCVVHAPLASKGEST